jgi:uncharacterized protein
MACTYCYYYDNKHADVYERPVLMSAETLEQTVIFLQDAVQTYHVKNLIIAFHGGEPTLHKTTDIRFFCENLTSRLKDIVAVRFAVQTNGLFLPKNWISLFLDFDFDIGISIDGSRNEHDRHRIDVRGRGTYDRIVENIARLRSKLPNAKRVIGAITVLTPDKNALEVYRHFTEGLGICRVKFLFPDATHDTVISDPMAQSSYSGSLCEVFDYWLQHHQQSVEIPVFDHAVRSVMVSLIGDLRVDNSGAVAITILSDGGLRIDDEFMIADTWFKEQRELNVFTHRLTDWVDQPNVQEIFSAKKSHPTDCSACQFAASCGGGMVPTRFSTHRRLDNPSVYCEDLFRLYSHISSRLTLGWSSVGTLERRFTISQSLGANEKG